MDGLQSAMFICCQMGAVDGKEDWEIVETGGSLATDHTPVPQPLGDVDLQVVTILFMLLLK